MNQFYSTHSRGATILCQLYNLIINSILTTSHGVTKSFFHDIILAWEYRSDILVIRSYFTHLMAIRIPRGSCRRVFVNSLRWRHNEHDSVSNHQPHDCFLNGLFRRRSKKTSKLRVTGLCTWNSPVTGEFPARRASDAENISIWWRHHVRVLNDHVISTVHCTEKYCTWFLHRC